MLQKRMIDQFKPVQGAKIYGYSKGRRSQYFVKYLHNCEGGGGGRGGHCILKLRIEI